MAPLTPEQRLAAALEQLKELEAAKETAARAEAEIAKLKESESLLKKKLENTASGSGSKTRFEPGTPFSSIIKTINFDSFATPGNDTNPGNEEIPDQETNKTNAAIMMAMLQEIQKLHSKIENIPGVPDPVPQVEADSINETPFVEEIAAVDLPKKFTVPSMKPYDGTTDPQNHVAIFKQKMMAASIPNELRQVSMCKGFSTTLTGAAMHWFINLPLGSIKNFADLVNAFNQQFASSRDMTKRPSNLFRVKQLSQEAIKDYLARFVKEMVAIPRCDEETAVEAFRQGVLPDSDIYSDLTKKACPTFSTVQSIVLEHVRLEEDYQFRSKSIGAVQNYGHTNRKSTNQRGGSSRPAPYYKSERSEVNMVQGTRGNISDLPTIPEYNFTVSAAGLVKRLERLGDTVRWPNKSDNPRRDPSRWCEFHQDIGHTTEECIQLRKQVAFLLKKGYLKDIMQQPRNKDGGSERKDPKNDRDLPLPPPPHLYEVKFINGGSEICGLTSSAAKKVARESKLQSPFRSKSLPAITFDDSDLQGVPDIHHDSLVITMQIGTAKVSRILIDGGSSVNLVMLDVLKAMKIDEDQLTKKSSVLVGFSGETKNTLGEISLPTYVEGVTSYERFGVLDCLSSYNIILGRPWIHNVKAIPSTYHQCVKIPTDWGITTIRGEQKSAQECYSLALKPSKPGKSLA